MAQILTYIVLVAFVIAAVDYVRSFLEGRARYRQYVSSGRARTEPSRSKARTMDTATEPAPAGEEGKQ